MSMHLVSLVVVLCLVKVDGQHIQSRIRKGEIPSRGVNLGGWLVVEKWMTTDSPIWKDVPDNIANQGEFATMQNLGHAKGDPLFETHRSTWITEQDIAEIAKFKLNTVRVPVGYWIAGFDNHDTSGKAEWKVFAPGGLKYLDLLINNWASKYNVAVLISVHAAKGSQNGKDHSAAPVAGEVYWGRYPENVDNTVDLVEFLASRYRNSPAFLGIGMLNEPEAPTDNQVLKDYYGRAYEKVRATGNDCILVHSPLLSQQGPNDAAWADFTPPPNFQNCWHEWHKYLVWGWEGKTEDQIMNEGVQSVANDISAWKGNWLFIGEWSLASPGSAPFSDADKLKEYGKRMIAAMNPAHAGWTFWSWKVSNDQGRNGWSMRSLLRAGIIAL